MYRFYLKRVLDLVFALLALPFWLIIFVVIAPLIYLEDRGPVFYNSNRLGKDGRVFKMYKFRSMKINAPDIRNEDGSTFNSDDDPRLTRIGKLIRKTSLDETPQLLNVIKGDMSFIGPRPDLPEALHMYDFTQRKKIMVRPGITGYNQAYFRNANTSTEKFYNDAYYVENVSFLFDLKILLKTISTVTLRKNVYNNEVEESLLLIKDECNNVEVINDNR